MISTKQWILEWCINGHTDTPFGVKLHIKFIICPNNLPVFQLVQSCELALFSLVIWGYGVLFSVVDPMVKHWCRERSPVSGMPPVSWWSTDECKNIVLDSKQIKVTSNACVVFTPVPASPLSYHCVMDFQLPPVFSTTTCGLHLSFPLWICQNLKEFLRN